LFLSSAVDPFTFGYVWTGQRFPHASNLTSNANADDFRHLMNLEKFLASNLDASRLPEFWWDTGEPDFDFFKSAAALFLCGHEEIAQGLRSGDMALMRYFFPGNRTFVHLTIYPERIAGRNREMTSHGIVLGNERRAAFEYRGRPVAVVIEDVIDSSRLH